MKMKLTLTLIVFLTVLNMAYASDYQTYYYYKYKDIGEYLSYEVYGVNLVTGEKNIVIQVKKGIGHPFILSDHSKIFFKCKNKICVYNHQTTSIDTLLHLGAIEELSYVFLVASTDEIHLSFIKKDAKVVNRMYHERERTHIAIDKDTYIRIQGITSYSTVKSLISRDGKKILQLVESKDGIYFKRRNIKSAPFTANTFAIDGYENVKMKYNPYFIDARNGYAFIGYLSEKDNKGHLVLCDPENKIALSQIVLPVGVPPYEKCLTPDGDMVFQDGGNIYIYDKNTAELKQRLKFQTSDDPDAESIIFMLGDSLYFFPEDPKESDATHFNNIGHADLTEVQSNSSLTEMMTTDLDDAYQKGWIDNKGIYNSLSKKLEHAQKQLDKGKTKQALNQLNAFLNQLEAQKGKHVNEEAYNLLHFNVEALIERMEG